jgi:hypothetical protein
MRILLGLTLLLASVSVFAMPAEEREETRIPLLDTAEEFFGHRVNHLANDFDSFFATERADDELGRSRFRLRYNYTVQERSIGRDDMQIRFNMRLPKLEGRFKFGDKDKKKNKKLTDEEKRKQEELYKRAHNVDERWLANADASANASIHPSLTLRGRVRKNKETGTLIHRFVQEISWVTTRDGFRNRTSLDTDHSFTQRHLFRFNNAVDWRISNKDFNTTHGPALLHRLSDFDAFSYNFTMSTTVQGGLWWVSNFQLAPNYRRNIYKQLLYFDVKPGLNFPKIWHFRRTPFVFVQLELLLGGN